MSCQFVWRGVGELSVAFVLAGGGKLILIRCECN